MIVFQNNHGMTNPGFGLGLAWSQEEFGFVSCSWNIVSRYEHIILPCFSIFPLLPKYIYRLQYYSHAEWSTCFPCYCLYPTEIH